MPKRGDPVPCATYGKARQLTARGRGVCGRQFFYSKTGSGCRAVNSLAGERSHFVGEIVETQRYRNV